MPMPHRGYLFTLVLVFLQVCSAQTTLDHSRPSFLRRCSVAPGQDGLCGFYEVPENRRMKNGRRIPLHIVLLTAQSGHGQPDPVIYLAGGPGDAATHHIRLVSDFPTLFRERDLLLIDQRGTGESNPLDCGRDAELTPLALTGTAPPGTIEACAGKLRGDPHWYTTNDAADDVADVVHALGYPKVNLYGVSYGTRLAQVIAFRHPDLVRSLVLQFVVPATGTLFINEARDAQAALDRWLAACDADKTCHDAYPDLRHDFQRVLQAATHEQRVVTLESGERVELSRTSLVLALNGALYQTWSATSLPLALHKAAGGDFSSLLSYALLTRLAAVDYPTGLYLSVVCSEDVEREKHLDLDRETANTYAGSALARALRQTCSRWPHASWRPMRTHPLPLPTLMLSGAVDPVASPARAVDIRAMFPESAEIIIPWMGHGPIDACIRDDITRFIQEERGRGFVSNCPPQQKPDFVFEAARDPKLEEIIESSRLATNPPRPATSLQQPAISVSGTWIMTFEGKKPNSARTKTLVLEQNGRDLKGTLTDEGGTLPVSGTIVDGNIRLSGKHVVTVQLSAVVNDNGEMSGTFDVLSIHLKWQARK